MKGRAHLLLAALLSTSVASVACTKTEGTSSGTTSTTGTAATSTPSGTTATTGTTSAASDAAPTTDDATTGTAKAGGADATAPTTSAAATGSAAPKASGTAAPAAAECGTKPLPDCPLQAWMKANTNPAVAANDLPALATAFDKTAGFAPAGYGNWASIAKDGAKAAKAGDMTAAKASCRTCHDQYKDKFKKDTALRARKI